MWLRKDENTVATALHMKRGGVPSLTSADLFITGKVVSRSELHIEGRLEGEVLAERLTIGETAEVKGWVLGAEVTVRGRVIGNIRAKVLHLAASAHVEGDLEHESLSVEAGAHIEGSCRHVQEGVVLPAEIETAEMEGKDESAIAARAEAAKEQVGAVGKG